MLWELTWIPGLAICATVISWDCLDQFLQIPFIARLVTLA
jgi:hypothetical protein